MNPGKHFTSVHVYLRFSSDGQADGYSFDRQREAAVTRLQAFGVPDTAVEWIEDPGLSAYKGRHLKTGELGKFLARIRSGALRDGLFICESVSRASRQGALVLLTMLKELLDAGFTVQFLDQTEAFDKDTMPRFLVIQLSLFADLAHEESRIKSEYAKKSWSKRRATARDNPGQVFSAECPLWLRVADNKYVLMPERVASIYELFTLARDGWGISRLVRHANSAKLVAPGKTGTWHTSLIKRVLSNRALIGEFQPHEVVNGVRTPSGGVITDFFPVAIDPDLFHTVQGLRAKAAKFPKRRDGNNFNYLLGLGQCECGGSWRRMNKNSGAQEGYALYGCSNRVRSTTDCPNINARAFDFQFVSFACETIPEMLASGDNPTLDRKRSLEAQLGEVVKRKNSVLAFVEEHFDLAAEFAERLRALVEEQQKISKELNDISIQATPPPGFSFGEVVGVFLPSYLDVFDPDSLEHADAFRARALFRVRIMESVAKVLVAKDRRSLTLRLKNGAETTLQLDPDIKFSRVNNELESVELEELRQSRQQLLSISRQMNNGGKAKG